MLDVTLSVNGIHQVLNAQNTLTMMGMEPTTFGMLALGTELRVRYDSHRRQTFFSARPLWIYTP